MRVFDAYSQYYDLLYKDKNYEAETNYVNSLINTYSKDFTSILELGCGTGIQACQFAKLGYKITGIDLSKTMLNMANSRKAELDTKLQSMLHFCEADIRAYSKPSSFDVVISLFHVMSYLQTNADLNTTFKQTALNLKKDGLFIFDCWYGPGVLADRPASRTRTFESDTLKITRVSNSVMHEEQNLVDVDFDITIENKVSGETNKLHEIHKMRYLFTEEIKQLAEANGFELLCAEEWLTKKEL
jgi:SAM-dependent methyltransferase